MAAPLVLVSGFGSFEIFARNPSGDVARALARRRIGAAGDVRVRAVILPVSFARAPRAWDRALARLGARPQLLLGLGVARSAGFRLESGAGPRLKNVPRPDVD